MQNTLIAKAIARPSGLLYIYLSPVLHIEFFARQTKLEPVFSEWKFTSPGNSKLYTWSPKEIAIERERSGVCGFPPTLWLGG
jgi:hypothetical protein